MSSELESERLGKQLLMAVCVHLPLMQVKLTQTAGFRHRELWLTFVSAAQLVSISPLMEHHNLFSNVENSYKMHFQKKDNSSGRAEDLVLA